MNEKVLEKRFDKIEKAIYNKFFIKNSNLMNAISESLKRHVRFIIFAHIRFTQVHNCLINAEQEKIYNNDEIRRKLRSTAKICIYLDKILEEIIELIS